MSTQKWTWKRIDWLLFVTASIIFIGNYVPGLSVPDWLFLSAIVYIWWSFLTDLADLYARYREAKKNDRS
ncbi:hypothetical protein SEA_FORZA_9 [Gordonia phage Forza]|uniref:Uncharacterized protein n=1 Tax=Gordonia phage Forza TaxID=2571247 RepID=A0A650FAV3_9CAUD|nr:hypothetical protein PP303_gp009 [Gordonia phage Forza]QEM41478.1 hypothetical protein SEA_BOOPY_9 [Gordonia phage Boopy]QGT55002.1 hypothetical protein SEA_FORZA_9 [Gordonia phage Forza]UXE04152.1 hypothetical protein SEA_BLUENGOLD_8 [Gordonia phage BlueNGold]WBF03790.1 membrane protein [Gordonia phage Mareelih]